MPVTLVSMKIFGPVMERSTWLSAAKLTMVSISCSSMSFSTSGPSQMSPCTNVYCVVILDLGQILEIARVGQLVEVHDADAGMLRQHHPDEVAPDEAGAARDQNASS